MYPSTPTIIRRFYFCVCHILYQIKCERGFSSGDTSGPPPSYLPLRAGCWWHPYRWNFQPFSKIQGHFLLPVSQTSLTVGETLGPSAVWYRLSYTPVSPSHSKQQKPFMTVGIELSVHAFPLGCRSLREPGNIFKRLPKVLLYDFL